MKRSPLKRGTSQLKRTPLSAVSAKRRAENAKRAKVLIETFGEQDTWLCEADLNPMWKLAMGNCFGPIHGHEIVKRSQGGSIVDASNIVLLCDYHNGWVENHRNQAHEFGLMRSNWEVE